MYIVGQSDGTAGRAFAPWHTIGTPKTTRTELGVTLEHYYAWPKNQEEILTTILSKSID